MISDFELVAQLYSFMESIPVLWSRELLERLYAEGEPHTEQRGAQDNFLQFEFEILEDGVKDDGRYLHILVSVTDLSRPAEQRGSSKSPFSTSFLLFESGEIDMPLAREIYERAF
jgi:hypothetical protein